MDCSLSEEQEMLAESVRGALQRAGGLRLARAWAEGEGSEVVGLAVRQGWLGIGVPEKLGGQGGDAVETMLLAEALGEVAAPGPLLPMQLAAATLAWTGPSSAPARALLEEACAGSSPLALAIAVDDPLARGVVASPAARRGDGWTLTGTIERGLGCADPELCTLLVPARTAEGELGLFVVDSAAAPTEEIGLLDVTRSLARIQLEASPARRVAVARSVAATLEQVTLLAQVLVAADSLGTAAALLEMTVAYVRERRQFGVPVGSFQAVKHSCADMLVDVETARSAAYYSAWAVANEEPDARFAAANAKWLVGEAACRVADRALALHGAIGFTWEHDLHLLLKRAGANRLLFGSPTEHRERIARHLLEPAGARLLGAVPAEA